MKYSEYYAKVRDRLVTEVSRLGHIHGSRAIDVFLEAYPGCCVDNLPEKVVEEMVQNGELRVLERAPNHSQRAFAGLEYSKAGYRQTPWGPGTILHYFYGKPLASV